MNQSKQYYQEVKENEQEITKMKTYFFYWQMKNPDWHHHVI